MFTENSKTINAGDMPSEVIQSVGTPAIGLNPHLKAKFDIYSGAESKEPSNRAYNSIDYITEVIREGNFGAKEFRDLFDAGEIIKAKITDVVAESDKEKIRLYESKKKNLPAVTFSCHLYNRKKAEKEIDKNKQFKRYNYLIQVDVDGLELEQANVVLAYAKQLPYVVLAFQSPSLNPKLVVAWQSQTLFDDTKFTESETPHKRAFRQIIDIIYKSIKTGLGIELPANFDTGINDVKRLCFLAYDTNVYLNKNAVPLLLDVSKEYESEVKKIAKSISQKRHSPPPIGINGKVSAVTDMIESAGVGNRYNSCYRAGCYAGGLIESNRIEQNEVDSAVKNAIGRAYSSEPHRIESAWKNYKNGVGWGVLNPLKKRYSTKGNAGGETDFTFVLTDYFGKKVNIHYSEILKNIGVADAVATLFAKLNQRQKNILYVNDSDTVRSGTDGLRLCLFNDVLGIYEFKQSMIIQNFLNELRSELERFKGVANVKKKELEKSFADESSEDKKQQIKTEIENTIFELKKVSKTLGYMQYEANFLIGVQRNLVLNKPDEFVISARKMDVVTHYIATRKGVVDLRNPANILPSAEARKILLTQFVDAEYRLKPKIIYSSEGLTFWEYHLKKMFGGSGDANADEALISNVLQYIYLTLCGVTTDEILWLVGNGHNGKSTLLIGLEKIFKQHYASIEPSVFLTTKDAKFERSKFEVAVIKNKKLVVANEAGGGDEHYINATALKAVTGAGHIQINPKYERTFELAKTANFIFSSNSIPLHTDESKAMFRRLRIIELKHDFEHDENKLTAGEVRELAGDVSSLLTMIIDAGLKLNGKYNIDWCEQVQKSNNKYQMKCSGFSVGDVLRVKQILQDKGLYEEKSKYSEVKNALESAGVWNAKIFKTFYKQKLAGNQTYFINFVATMEKMLK